MKAKRVREIRQLVGSPEFVTWYQRYHALRTAIDDARARRSDLLMQVNMMRFKAELSTQVADDKLFLAGECEDRSAQALAEFTEIENNSFEMLSQFEQQRQRASDAWAGNDRAEQMLENERTAAADLRARIEAARKVGSEAGVAEAETLQARLKESELQIEQYARDLEAAHGRESEAEGRREALWLDVEAAWSSAFRANMARTEYAYQARKVRHEVEELFARAALERGRVDHLEAEAERTIKTATDLEADFDIHLSGGRDEFDCALTKEFLFWPHRDDVRLALCVPLIDEPNHFNIQVRALEVYVVERNRGLEHLEPMVDDVESKDEDPRLEAFFSSGRREQQA